MTLFVLILLVGFVYGPSSTVSNIVPRRDSQTSQIMDIHDGNTIRIGNTFFWYGAGYGDCEEMATGCASIAVGSCGFNLNHTVNLATSTDLIQWTFHGAVLPESARSSGILFSPWVARSAATGLYVLWYNLLPVIDGQGDFDLSYYQVATSPSPYGPFKVANVNVTGIDYKLLPDAPSIFVDDDGLGYIAFTHENTHINHVQQLSPDLLGPLTDGKVSEQIGGGNNEGILMFKRNGLYYVMFGPCCCFCSEGSAVEAFKATSPLGPYESLGYIITQNAWGAQTGSVWWTGVDWVLYGDRWQSAPDKLKAHDFSYWAPLVWNPDGTVVEIQSFQNQVTINY